MMGTIKNFIRNAYCGEMMINTLHRVEGFILPKIISDEEAVKRYYKRYTGKEIDLSNPKTFSEKMNWYKLNGRKPLMSQCADKAAMREYVIAKGYGKYLNEIIGVYSSVKEIDFTSLPDRFVAKATHGTHMQIVVTDKSSINWKKTKKRMSSWLRQDIYWRGREWVYKDIPRRIIIEKYLEGNKGDLQDYKIFCFNGTPRFVQVDKGRYLGRHIRNFYNTEWSFLDISDDVGSDSNVVMEKPTSFEKMLEISKKLSEEFQFVRVDFYEIDETPLVGELTFFHNGGLSRMEPEKWELIIGDYWELER